MAAPNLVNVTSIFGKTAFDADISTSDEAILSNGSTSNKLLKVNTLIITNIDGGNNANITITIKTGGTISGYLAYTVSVPADGAFVAISKDAPIYLEENMAIHLDAAVAGDLSAVCSYEEIDDA